MEEKKVFKDPEITTYDRQELDLETALTGPSPSSGCNCSSIFMACIATVRPSPASVRVPGPSIGANLPRIVPPLSQ